MNPLEERTLINKVKQGDIIAYETLFHNYYSYLCAFATKVILNPEAAEEIVQDFFVKLWENRTDITIDTSVKNYLFRSVKNRCLNHIKHEKVKLQHTENVLKNTQNHQTNHQFYEVYLADEIERSIEELPAKRREIFRLSRQEGLKYREIAERMNLSVKTVEAQMGLAIKYLREKLKKYNTFLFYFLRIQKSN